MGRWTVKVYDSLKHPDPMEGFQYKVVVYEPAWQGIRVNLSFTGYEKVRKSIVVCKTYIDRAPSTYELLHRVIRVHNLLAAIPVYDERQDANSVDLIQSTMMWAKEMMDDMDHYVEWDWHKARMQAYTMYTDAHAEFKKMHTSLKDRSYRPGKKKALRYFLSIIDEVVNENTAA